MTYEKGFKEEAVRLSDEIGVRKASEQLGIPYYTLVGVGPKLEFSITPLTFRVEGELFPQKRIYSHPPPSAR